MKKIAVTGLGVVSPLGSDIQKFWANLIEAQTGIERIDAFADLPVTFGGPAKGFDPSRYLGNKELRHLDRYAQMAVTAGLDACRYAGLEEDSYSPYRTGVLIGTGAGGINTIESQVAAFNNRGPRRISPMTVPMFIGNSASAELAMRIQARGPGMGISSACATGGHAIAVSMMLIASGEADCMVTGSVEACLTPFAVSAFASMKALSTRNDEPEKACRPFDADRDGFVMSEGGAVLVLEDYDKAQARGAHILAVLSGMGMTQDAYHIVAPDPDGGAVVHAIERAIADAGISPGEIGYINAHGTSTLLNDKAETAAIKKVFGQKAYTIPISSTKSMTGHLIGGAASLETVICVLVLNNGMIPPTINFDKADPECDLDYVPNRAVNAEISYCLNNSFGFGGQNVALIIGKDS